MRTVRCKALRLACWNADGVHGRKLELKHFLSQHCVDICLLSETFLKPHQAFRLAYYVCHHKDRPTTGSGTANLVRRGIVHHSLPVPGLNHFEATAVQVILASRPVKILAAYLSPSRPLIGSDLTTCFGGGLLVLMAGDLNAKHVDWNSWLTTRRGKLLRNYADWNSYLIFWHSNHQPIQPLRYSRCLGHLFDEGRTVPGLFDFVLCTKLGPHPGTHWHCVSLILSSPTG